MKLSIVDDEPTLDVRTMLLLDFFFNFVGIGVLRNITEGLIHLITIHYILLSVCLVIHSLQLLTFAIVGMTGLVIDA